MLPGILYTHLRAWNSRSQARPANRLHLRPTSCCTAACQRRAGARASVAPDCRRCACGAPACTSLNWWTVRRALPHTEHAALAETPAHQRRHSSSCRRRLICPKLHEQLRAQLLAASLHLCNVLSTLQVLTVQWPQQTQRNWLMSLVKSERATGGTRSTGAPRGQAWGHGPVVYARRRGRGCAGREQRRT